MFYFCRIETGMDGLKEKLETAYKASGGRKVNIISHSMGGLLVTCFMSLHQDVCILSLDFFMTLIEPICQLCGLLFENINFLFMFHDWQIVISNPILAGLFQVCK